MRMGSSSLLDMFRGLFKHDDDNPPRLWIITRGATEAGGSGLAIAQSAVWGLGRTIMHEHQHVDTVLIDGRLIVQKGVLLTLDEGALVDECQKVGKKIFENLS